MFFARLRVWAARVAALGMVLAAVTGCGRNGAEAEKQENSVGPMPPGGVRAPAGQAVPAPGGGTGAPSAAPGTK